MKTRLWLLPVLFSLWPPDTVMALNTEDVVRLHASGYSDDQINEVLAATQSEFLLSARDVVYLTQSGVSDPIVQNMLVALPLQPVNGDATLEAEPVRLMFSQEDLQLLAENHVSEPVVVTFIETRDMAFTLDTQRLTSLRQSGLGLDALQILVEKSAAGLPVPLAPAPAPLVAGTSDSSAYFYGRSGYSLTSYGDSYSGSHYGSPAVYIQSRTIYPWYGYSGFTPNYVTYYPYWWYGYGVHTVYCPHGRHHHGGGGYHHGGHGPGGNHGNGHHNDGDGKGGNYQAGSNPGGTKPGRGTGYYNGGDSGNNTVGVFFGTGTKSGSGTGHYNTGKPYGPGTAGVYNNTGTKPIVSAGSGDKGTGSKSSGSYGMGIKGPGSSVGGIKTAPGTSTAATFTPRSGATPSVADTRSNDGGTRSSPGRSAYQEEGTGSGAFRVRAGTSTNFVADQGRRVKPR